MKQALPIACAVTAAMAASSAAWATPRITSTVDVKPEAQLSQAEQESVSLSAGQLLIHVDKARQAIKTQNLETAGQEVEKGLTLAKIIESAMPSYLVKTDNPLAASIEGQEAGAGKSGSPGRLRHIGRLRKDD